MKVLFCLSNESCLEQVRDFVYWQLLFLQIQKPNSVIFFPFNHYVIRRGKLMYEIACLLGFVRLNLITVVVKMAFL